MSKLFLIVLALLVGCTGEPQSKVQATPEFTVERLFVIDGCTVYRFHDSGHYRYFSNCNGGVSWTESCGKNCTRQMNVPTNKE